MPTAMQLYRGLREDLPAHEFAALRVEVRAHYERLKGLQRHNELLAIDLAEQLCERLEGLLAGAHQLHEEARASVVGAARYFVSPLDAVPDAQDCVGLDDDVEVFNRVVIELDRPDLVIAE